MSKSVFNTYPLAGPDMYGKGVKVARCIVKEYARTFYFASLLLKKQKKDAAYILYAICRLTDEAVDACDPENSNMIRAISEKIESAYKNHQPAEPLIAAFQTVIATHDIPKIYFDQLLQGLRMDLVKKRYRDFDDLHSYCYMVAGVVGLIMLQIFGFKDARAKECAIELGIAMQLTNILRDIDEDYRRGRIYLPQEELRLFGVSEENISRRVVNRNFISFMKFQIARARRFYLNARNGTTFLSDARSRFAVSALQEMYSGILTRIEKNGYDVFSKRAHVTSLGKIGIIIQSMK